MTFYVSESLKGRVGEEQLIKDEPIFATEKLIYAEIATNKSKFFLGVVSIEKGKHNDNLSIEVPEDASILAGVTKVLNWTSVALKINNGSGLDNITIYEYDDAVYELKEIQKSLYGYNYKITIINNNKI